MTIKTKAGATLVVTNPDVLEQYLKHGAVEVNTAAAPKKKKVIEDKIRD